MSNYFDLLFNVVFVFLTSTALSIVIPPNDTDVDDKNNYEHDNSSKWIVRMGCNFALRNIRRYRRSGSVYILINASKCISCLSDVE